MARTDGTSAELTISLSLATTKAGVDHPLAVRSANFSEDFVPSRSTQLRTTRSPETVICGTELFAPAGEFTASTVNVAARCACAATHQIAKPANIPMQVFVMCDPNQVPNSR